MGLGLPVSYSIMQSLGGSIKVFSKDGKGAEFKVLIPVRSEEEKTEILSTEKKTGLGTGKILVVDDEKSIRELLSNILRSSGFTMKKAENGKNALALAEAFQPDVILLDLIMPETNTEELIKQLLVTLPEVSIIAVTGVGAVELEKWRVKLAGYGITDIILKPFDTQKLIDVIRGVLLR